MVGVAVPEGQLLPVSFISLYYRHLIFLVFFGALLGVCSHIMFPGIDSGYTLLVVCISSHYCLLSFFDDYCHKCLLSYDDL